MGYMPPCARMRPTGVGLTYRREATDVTAPINEELNAFYEEQRADGKSEDYAHFYADGRLSGLDEQSAHENAELMVEW